MNIRQFSHGFLMVLLALAGCATGPSSAPEPWASALAEYPVPAHAYRAKYSTLCHHLLDMDSQVEAQDDAKYQLLDMVLADAQKSIHWNADEKDPAQRRAMALAAFAAMDQLIREHNIIYPPAGNINTMHEGLEPHRLSAEEQKLALGTNPPALAPWLAAHADERFYFMDCDILSFLYISIGQVVGLPLEFVACPDHAFVRYEVGDGTHINWETTLGEAETDRHFAEHFKLTWWNEHDRAFMVDLTPEEILGYYLCCRAIWQEHMSKPRLADACGDYEEAIELYPECSLARNNLAWLYLSVPKLSKRSGEEVLQLALGAMAVVPDDFEVADTVACAYAEVGDFDKAMVFERDAIKAADSDLNTTAAVRDELHERLGIFVLGKTYLEALADGSVTPVTPEQRRER